MDVITLVLVGATIILCDFLCVVMITSDRVYSF